VAARTTMETPRSVWNRQSSGNVERNMGANSNRPSRKFVVGLLGGVGRDTLSFLLQLIKQILAMKSS
jgi:hypothetical protein